MRITINYIKIFALLIASICFGSTSYAQFYNGTQTDFGKNRVQYDFFEWQYYRFQKFETYFYTGGKELAVHTAKFADSKISKIEKFLDFYNDEKIQFVIYNKQSHFRQSNIGLATDENYNIGGVTNIVGSKIFIYFEGDYEKFNRQIEAGIYKVLIYQMIYGGNWREILRNSALLHLPEWYISGLTSYLSDPNNSEINSRIKDGIANENFKRFNGLNKDEALIAGHSMWKYIADSYGINVISNILYMTRVSRNIDDGFLYVLGVPFEDLYSDWLEFYNLKNKTAQSMDLLSYGEPLPIKTKKDRLYQNLIFNSDNSHFAYNTNLLGQFKIYIVDKNTKKKKKIYTGDHKLERIQDYTYPILTWHPNNKVFNFIIEKKGEVLLYSYNLETEKLNSKPIFKMEKVLSFSYSKSGKQIVFSGVYKGQSDLFLYNPIGNTQKNITNDIYDDLDPKFLANGYEILFTSNRDNDSLNLPHLKKVFNSDKDIFIYDLNNRNDPLRSVTDTDQEEELWPMQIENQILFHSNKGGSITRYTAEYDSAVSFIDTTVHYNFFYKTQNIGSYLLNPLSISSNGSDNLINQINYSDGRFRLYQSEFDFRETERIINKKEIDKSTENNIFSVGNNLEYLKVEKFSNSPIEKEVNILDYQFSNGSSKTTGPKKSLPNVESILSDEINEELVFPTQRIYRPNFSPDNSIIQLNNAFINGQYQIYNGGPFSNPGLGVNTKIGIVDVFEDYRIYGGFRLSGDVSEYSLNYQNLRKRMDKEYSITRRAERISNTFIPTDLRTLQGAFSVKWPFSEVTSIRTSLVARNDKRIPLAGNLDSLSAPITNKYWASAKAAYVFDNTRDVALNIKYGTRFKVFAEHYQLVYSEREGNPSSNFSVFGFDFRNYQKLHKEIILVTRFAGSKSIGLNPLVYYLGGVDEWWKADLFDENTPIDNSQNYGFQALGANMRGFLQNVRNGNNFAVMNNEVRVPVFAYLINRPIQSDFIRNFQVVGFGDIGTAWVGKTPFSDDNPFNNEIKVTNPITVTYENINDPVVGGFGFGVRSTLFGYFIRADWGWGVENGVISEKSLFMFSLSLDI